MGRRFAKGWAARGRRRGRAKGSRSSAAHPSAPLQLQDELKRRLCNQGHQRHC